MSKTSPDTYGSRFQGWCRLNYPLLQAVALYVNLALFGPGYKQKCASSTGKCAQWGENILRARRSFSPKIKHKFNFGPIIVNSKYLVPSHIFYLTSYTTSECLHTSTGFYNFICFRENLVSSSSESSQLSELH